MGSRDPLMVSAILNAAPARFTTPFAEFYRAATFVAGDETTH
jgi:hypothetical protein